MMDGNVTAGIVALVCAGLPGLAPAFAKRWGAALLFAALGVGAMLTALYSDRTVGGGGWVVALIIGFVFASAAQRADRQESQRRAEHAEILAELRRISSILANGTAVA